MLRFSVLTQTQARGDHSAALRASLRGVEILSTELDPPPSPETLQLADSIHRRESSVAPGRAGGY